MFPNMFISVLKKKQNTKQKLHLKLSYSFLRGQESLAKTHQKYL